MGNDIELSGLETELRLGLPGGEVEKVNERKRVFSDFLGSGGLGKDNGGCKNQVVGWPPVCSYRMRKNEILMMMSSKMYVKVSMDGEPFLRKIDLDMHKGYDELVMALEKLFGCYGIGDAVLKGEDNCEYVPIYEDKDGDWMLVGDVPWEMFIDTCKRLRIMKKSDAKFIATKGLLKLLSKKDE